MVITGAVVEGVGVAGTEGAVGAEVEGSAVSILVEGATEEMPCVMVTEGAVGEGVKTVVEGAKTVVEGASVVVVEGARNVEVESSREVLDEGGGVTTGETESDDKVVVEISSAMELVGCRLVPILLVVDSGTKLVDSGTKIPPSLVDSGIRLLVKLLDSGTRRSLDVMGNKTSKLLDKVSSIEVDNVVEVDGSGEVTEGDGVGAEVSVGSNDGDRGELVSSTDVVLSTELIIGCIRLGDISADVSCTELDDSTTLGTSEGV